MNRNAIRLLINVGLFVLGCFLLATIVVAAIPKPAPVATSLAHAAPAPVRAKSWQDRKVILDRNLFNASTLDPDPTTPIEDDLEATKLPLKLLGTVAGAPEQSWAAVLDEETGEHLVVRVDDMLKDRAQVVRIERRRLVLENGQRREELALSEEPAPKSASARRTARAAPRARPSARGRSKEDVQARIERLAENRFSLSRDEVQEAARNPAGLFSQARILPKYDAGQMVGVQVNAIKTGSTLEEIGLQNGDTISEVNGMRITSPEDSTEVLRELAQANQFTVVVTGADGQERTLTYELEE